MLPISPHFDYHSEDELVWTCLSTEQKLVVTDRVHEIRPRKAPNLRQRLSDKLTAKSAKELLGDNLSEIEAAVNQLFPLERSKKSKAKPVKTWLTGLENWQKRAVINKVARDTLQDTERLRDRFLDNKVTPEQALHLLNALPEDCRRMAAALDLIMPDFETCLPWQKGLSKLQRKALLHRMMTVGRRCEKTSYDLLERRKLPPGYGLKMLEANDADFLYIMRCLKGSADLPE
ncbi:hypothetical protein CBS101457_000178 [Exobasidium rhododendri]|nr:hypothetical protein CBS101457_000178 [Exobasidium rhododendri]